jgi:hypothetical protein
MLSFCPLVAGAQTLAQQGQCAAQAKIAYGEISGTMEFQERNRAVVE